MSTQKKPSIDSSTIKSENDYPNITSPMGSIFLRKKIDTQRDQPHEEVDQGGRFGGNNGGDNFFLFSPPDFSLDGKLDKK